MLSPKMPATMRLSTLLPMAWSGRYAGRSAALDLATDADDVVEVLVDELLDHPRRGRGVVGVVAVDQQVDVGVDVGEGPSYDVALALERLAAHDGAGAHARARSVRSVLQLS